MLEGMIQGTFRMPAEWEPQEAVWLSWPHNKITWGDDVDAIEGIYAKFSHALAPGQTVNILVADEEREQRARAALGNNGALSPKIRLLRIVNQDGWIRDYGPTFVIDNVRRDVAMIKWTFNAWGNKYPDLLPDNAVPYAMQEYLKTRLHEPGIVLEGGSIEVNGSGTLLTSEQCLLNPNRNPSLDRAALENLLSLYLGTPRVLWLKDGIVGDDTDGHIDDLARFVNETTVVCAYEEDHNDVNYPMLRENFELLSQMRTVKGQQLGVVKLPMPAAVMDGEKRLPASYANFYIGNAAVVVPLFGCDNDRRALDILRPYFPDRQIVGIDCTRMVYGFGTLHCGSQQQPKAAK